MMAPITVCAPEHMVILRRNFNKTGAGGAPDPRAIQRGGMETDSSFTHTGRVPSEPAIRA